MNDPFARLDALPAMDLTLCVFPHLRRLLLLDCRTSPPTLHTLAAEDVFTPAFHADLERRFVALAREGSRFPFQHMLSLSGRVDELVHTAAIDAVLRKVGATRESPPRVAVLVMSGGGLAQPPALLLRAFHRIMGPKVATRSVEECVGAIERLVLEERLLARQTGWRETGDMLKEGPASFFALWERRN